MLVWLARHAGQRALTHKALPRVLGQSWADQPEVVDLRVMGSACFFSHVVVVLELSGVRVATGSRRRTACSKADELKPGKGYHAYLEVVCHGCAEVGCLAAGRAGGGGK